MYTYVVIKIKNINRGTYFMKFISGKKAVSFIKEALKILIILAICAGLGIFLAVGNRASSPEKFAEQYFSHYVTNNFEEMYEMVDCEESEFITLENFVNKCEGEKIYGSIRGYSFSKGVRKGDKLTYVVSYYLGSESQPHTYSITLNEQDEKTHMFFNTWKVSVENMIIEDYKINVPVGRVVTLDGMDIKKYYSKTSEDGTVDTYIIDRLFTGDHTIAVNLDATGEITKTEYVSHNGQEINITTNDFAMKPDVQQKLYEYSTYIVKTMYEYAMDSTKNSEHITSLYANTDEAKASAKATFEAIRAAIQKENGASLRVLDIKTLSPSIQEFIYPDRVAVKVTYNYEFKAVTGTSVLSGIIEEYSGSGSDTAYVYLNLIDGAWKIVKVDLTCIDYSKQG